MDRDIESIKRFMAEKNVEYRNFEFETRAAEDKLTVRGTPIVFDTETKLFETDYAEYREIIASGALDDADVSDVIFNYGHGGRVYARTRNKTLRLSVKKDKVEMEADLLSDDEGHRQLYRDIETKNIDQMSFAFSVSEQTWEREEREGERLIIRRIIKGIKRVFDVSAVDIAAYDATDISVRNVFGAASIEDMPGDGGTEAESLELRKRKYEILWRLT